MSQPEGQKHKAPAGKMILIRFGCMGTLGWFEHHESEIPVTAQYGVIKTDRGLELGEIVGTFSYTHGKFKSTAEQVVAYYAKGQEECPVVPSGTFVRFATHDDIMEAQHLKQSSEHELKTCKKFVREMKLPMKMISGEHLLGGERIVLYFTSPGRVDFRELVKRLAKEFQTRIELRQVGSRDEARILADFETCGQQCCCQRFLKILEPVNMKMAKLQKATLDPSKISGHCGRLKCCLRYEDQTYKQLKNNLPNKNVMVKTPNNEGKVVDVQLLTQLVVVQDEKGDRTAWPVDEIEVIQYDKNKADQQNKNEKIEKPKKRPEKEPAKNQTNDSEKTQEASNQTPQADKNEKNKQQKQDQKNNQGKDRNTNQNNKNKNKRNKNRRRWRNKKKNNNQNKQDS